MTMTMMTMEISFFIRSEWTKEKNGLEQYEKHSKCMSMFTRPHTILFAIVHFSIESHLLLCSYMVHLTTECCPIVYIALIFIFHSENYYFLYFSLRQMCCSKCERTGTQISQHQATKNGQSVVCAKTEKKLK